MLRTGCGSGQVGSENVRGEQGGEDLASTLGLHPYSTQSPISDEQTDRGKVGRNEADIQNEVQTELLWV